MMLYFIIYIYIYRYERVGLVGLEKDFITDENTRKSNTRAPLKQQQWRLWYRRSRAVEAAAAVPVHYNVHVP